MSQLLQKSRVETDSCLRFFEINIHAGYTDFDQRRIIFCSSLDKKSTALVRCRSGVDPRQLFEFCKKTQERKGRWYLFITPEQPRPERAEMIGEFLFSSPRPTNSVFPLPDRNEVRFRKRSRKQVRNIITRAQQFVDFPLVDKFVLSPGEAIFSFYL